MSDGADARSPVAVAAWLAELAIVPTGLALAYLPGSGGVNARTREQLILAVTEVNGVATSAWVHGAWLDFLGRRDPDEVLQPLFDYARSCAEYGHPLDTTTLDAVYPPSVVRTVRATVARAELGNVAGDAVEGLIETAVRHRPLSVWSVLRQSAIVTATLPFTVPAVGIACSMRVLDALAPSLPEVSTSADSEGDLMVDLAAQAVPTFLGNTLLRTGLVWAPVSMSIAFRMEGSTFTVTVGRGAVSVDRGISDQALVVVDGGLDSLVRMAANSMVRELTNPRPMRKH